MRRLTTSLFTLLVLGWAPSAEAGTVNSTWDLSRSTAKTKDTTTPSTITANSVMGTMCLTFSNAASTKSSIPHSQSTIALGCLTSTVTGSYLNLQKTVKAKLISTVTGLHLSSNGQLAGSASGRFRFTSLGHCPFFCGVLPGTWTASVTKTNMFSATVHLPAQKYYNAIGYHTTGSGCAAQRGKFFRSGTLKITLPNGHLVSSNSGYHTMHLSAKQN